MEVGGLPEDYFMYVEDIHFCRRILRAGHELYSVPQVEVVHIGGASGRDLPRDATTRWVENLHRFFARDHSTAAIVAFDMILGTGLAIRTVLYFLRSLAPAGSFYRRNARVMAASSMKAYGLAGQTVVGSESRRPDED
jgi:GT2 family glycosyltransferase